MAKSPTLGSKVGTVAIKTRSEGVRPYALAAAAAYAHSPVSSVAMAFGVPVVPDVKKRWEQVELHGEERGGAGVDDGKDGGGACGWTLKRG